MLFVMLKTISWTYLFIFRSFILGKGGGRIKQKAFKLLSETGYDSEAPYALAHLKDATTVSRCMILNSKQKDSFSELNDYSLK